MPSDLHERLVKQLVDDGCGTRKFSQRVARAVGNGKHVHVPVADGDVMACDWCYVYRDLVENRVIPDAFRISRRETRVVAYEVEVSSPMSEEKLEKYSNLWWLLDEFYWTLHIIVVDRYGRQSEVDVLAMDRARYLSQTTPEQLAADREFWGQVLRGEAAP